MVDDEPQGVTADSVLAEGDLDEVVRRLAAGIKSIAVAAARSGLSTATISRIENAKQTILPRTVRLLCHCYGIGAPLLDHLLRLAEESEDRGWLVAYSDTTPNWFERYLGEEAEASEIWEYGAEFIPGLLQTAGYCRAVRAANSADVTEEEIARSVEFRLARQELLERESPPRLHVVVNESVLRRHVGGRKVMREQLRHLAEMAKRPNVTVQVLPFNAGARPAMTGSFIMLHWPTSARCVTARTRPDRCSRSGTYRRSSAKSNVAS